MEGQATWQELSSWCGREDLQLLTSQTVLSFGFLVVVVVVDVCVVIVDYRALAADEHVVRYETNEASNSIKSDFDICVRTHFLFGRAD